MYKVGRETFLRNKPRGFGNRNHFTLIDFRLNGECLLLCYQKYIILLENPRGIGKLMDIYGLVFRNLMFDK